MTIQSKARITAIGSYVPDQILSNADLEKMVDTTDEWIIQRTGMRERRIAGPEQFVSDLSIKAVEALIHDYKAAVDDVDLILVATSTADYGFPSVASRVQKHFGIPSCGAMDLGAACAGFTYGLHMANGLISSGLHKKVLVIGGETLSKITDYTDRSSCILFGDGASAMLVEYDVSNPSFITSDIGTAGEGGQHLYRAGLSASMDGVALNNNGFLVQNGREVYKWAVRSVPAGVERLLHQAKMGIDELNWFVPHSANLRMIESISDRLQLPMEQTLTSVEYCGNTSAASIPLALQNGLREGKLKQGDKVILYGFGGGLTYAGLLIQWGAPDLI
ncbi:ketoacyl-ACP synthase III [Paenibacillus sp. JX-17]|uniref:Beta-ketoacyl-[acyl-carrier-protein] synthase III n=1 Tax=Paenibacillus lacisoli TaxID=3064525 RepID=A0ABT9CG23_9BACL|nr:ketoacyl-ACP synthase III [Paenibacillus sp. JX-17]MDO7907523.1 ketoacyl-ACP synthase III [Paenibacillus sp. JX-17]